jgi:hypothetical protein
MAQPSVILKRFLSLAKLLLERIGLFLQLPSLLVSLLFSISPTLAQLSHPLLLLSLTIVHRQTKLINLL